MRKCIRCDSNMIEDMELMVSTAGHGLDVREKGFFKGSLGKVICAICPQCGYVESYIEDTRRIKNIVKRF